MNNINSTPQKVPLNLLEQLAAQLPQPPAINQQSPVASNGISATNGNDWFDQWVAKNDSAIDGQFHPHNGGRLARVACPWNPAHGKDAYVMQLLNGAIAAGCQHASCKGKNWQDYRAVKEPGYQPGQPAGANPALTSAVQKELGSPVTWTIPTPLPLYLKPALPELDNVLIPSQFLVYCTDVAHRKQVSIEYVVISLIVTVSCLLGNKFLMYAKQRDNWTVTPNIWAMIIGAAGQLKTPVINEVTRFLRAIEDEFKLEFKKEKSAHTATVKALENQMKPQKQTQAKNKTVNTPPITQQQIDQLQIQLDQLNANPPKLKRRIIKDVTIEKLQMILGENPEGCLLLWDELVTFFTNLEKQGHETDRGFFLEAWTGTSSYTVDRVSRDSVIIDRLCLSIFGTIQPDVLIKQARQSIDKHGSDGFLSRFQLFTFTSRSTWEYTDLAPDPEAQQLIEDITVFLSSWKPANDINGAKYRKDNPGQIGIGFDTDAQALFVRWYTEIQQRLLPGVIESARMREHLSKYPALMLKLSLIFHCAEHAINKAIPHQVNELTAARAIAWCEYLEPHAEHLYGTGKAELDHTIKVALALLEKIKEGKIKSTTTVSQITRNEWSNLKEKESVTTAINLLDEYDWLRLTQKTTQGRPSISIEINPDAVRLLQETANYATEIHIDKRPRPWLDKLKGMLEPQPAVDWPITLQYWQDIMELDEDEYNFDEYEDLDAQAAAFILI